MLLVRKIPLSPGVSFHPSQFSEPLVFFADLTWLLKIVIASVGPSVPGLLGKKDPEYNPTNICIFRICATGKRSFPLPKYLECLSFQYFYRIVNHVGGDIVCRGKGVK